jgi:oxygen-dependent protoporphyrinogen oxidase
VTAESREVVVIGGGISGLAAAFELSGGAAGPSATTPSITILEASHRLGGKIMGLTFEGRSLDAGPDGALARRPELAALCEDLGIADHLRPISARGASVFARRQVRPLPEGLNLGVPTSWSALRSSKVLSRRGSLRALRDLLWPVPASRGHLQDRTIGSLVETKLGPEVVASLVDPMVGGINAGRVAQMSAAAIFPPLLDAGQGRGSLMRAMRASLPAPPPDGTEPPAAFSSLSGGIVELVDVLSDELIRRGVVLRCGADATHLVRQGGSSKIWSVNTETTATRADGVILAVPSGAASRLLSGHDDEAAALANQIDYASVAIATFSFDEEAIDLPEHGTGVLVPAGSVIPGGEHAGQRFVATALTFLDRKWAHLKLPGTTVLRVHCGRIDDDRFQALDDDALLGILAEELGQLLSVRGAPRASALTRWDHGLPQYRVNHLMRVAGVESGVERLSGLEIAGAAFHGVGVPACIGSGRAAARRLLEELGIVAR